MDSSADCIVRSGTMPTGSLNTLRLAEACIRVGACSIGAPSGSGGGSLGAVRSATASPWNCCSVIAGLLSVVWGSIGSLLLGRLGWVVPESVGAGEVVG